MASLGISGHQDRPGVDWNWVRHAIDSIFHTEKFSAAFTCLAQGSDQIFATCALQACVPVHAVIPVIGYEKYFRAEALPLFKELLSKSELIELKIKGSAQDAFYEAGVYVVEQCDIMIAVWDGLPAKGRGGTADIVKVCERLDRPFIHINPVTQEVIFNKRRGRHA